MEMDSPTLIANRGRASGRFGSKRFFSRFFPKSVQGIRQSGPVDADNAVVYPDDAFQNGITFEAKLVGMLDIPRPQTRLEIVAAMRRVRYDHKAKGTEKRKVDIRVGTDGVRVSGHNSGNRRFGLGRVEYDKLDNVVALETEANTILHHPIHRIFYVSHDSQDLNVFSYIVRENQADTLRCIVFKALRRSDAMQIVKTIGQAFDVCHQIQLREKPKPSSTHGSPGRIGNSSTLKPQQGESPGKHHVKLDHEHHTVMPTASSSMNFAPAGTSSTEDSDLLKLCRQQRLRKSYSDYPTHGPRVSFTTRPLYDISPRISAEPTESSQTSGLGSSSSFRQKSSVSSVSAESGVLMSATSESDGDHTPSSSCNPVCVTQVRLEYEQQKERVARSQIQFLKSQLASETAARVDAQNRIDELLRQNAMLLDVVESLLGPTKTAPSQGKRGTSDVLAEMEIAQLLGPSTSSNMILQKKSSESTAINLGGHQVASRAGSSPDSGIRCPPEFVLCEEESF